MWYSTNYSNKQLLFNRLCKYIDRSKSMYKNTMEMEINSFARTDNDNSIGENRVRYLILRTLYTTLVVNGRLGYLYGINPYIIVQYMFEHQIFPAVSMMFQKLMIKSRLHPDRPLSSYAELYWNQFFDRIDADIRTNGLPSWSR